MYGQTFCLQADLLKALAHPRRLEIIYLLGNQELPVTDIYTMLDLPQASISQQLMILREVKIVHTRREGKQVYYSLCSQEYLKLCDLVREEILRRYKSTDLEDELNYDLKEVVPLSHDPVCNMRVSRKRSDFVSDYQGKKYFFCASGCLKKFSENPEKYVKE